MTSTLKIGWGKRSIAMDGPVPITGQFHLRISFGAYTDVIVSALVLDNEQDSVIFVSADMVSVSPTLLSAAQEILKKEMPEIPAEKIILNATHTHAGPSARPLSTDYPSRIRYTPAEEVNAFIARQIADAVMEAWNKRAEGSIAYGYGFAVTGHSRRVVYQDDVGLRMGGTPGLMINGHAKMYGNTNDSMVEGYECGLDPFINLLYTFDKDEKLTGAIVNVPCPSQTGENTWMLHASFWHNVREKLSEAYGDVGVIAQAAAAGDLSPRQLHYLAAEGRRYRLKYPHLRKAMEENPLKKPKEDCPNEGKASFSEYDLLEFMRAEDIANRIVDAFDEVLSWASREKFSQVELKHEIRVFQLARRFFPEIMAEEEKKNYEAVRNEPMTEDGEVWAQLHDNSIRMSRLLRSKGVVDRYAMQDSNPTVPTQVHIVRVGNIAFASNPFELYMSFMHRMQARSPFEQTFVVQLTSDPMGARGYLATERAIANKGYSASPYCNVVSPEGGQQLVDETLKVLEELKK